MPPESPAFVCERIGVELELCRLADTAIVDDLSRQRRNMLYVSRGQLKKHSSTILNLSVAVRYISQQVTIFICIFYFYMYIFPLIFLQSLFTKYKLHNGT